MENNYTKDQINQLLAYHINDFQEKGNLYHVFEDKESFKKNENQQLDMAMIWERIRTLNGQHDFLRAYPHLSDFCQELEQYLIENNTINDFSYKVLNLVCEYGKLKKAGLEQSIKNHFIESKLFLTELDRMSEQLDIFYKENNLE